MSEQLHPSAEHHTHRQHHGIRSTECSTAVLPSPTSGGMGVRWFGVVPFGSVWFGGFGGRKRAKNKKVGGVFLWFGLVWRGSVAEKGQKKFAVVFFVVRFGSVWFGGVQWV